MNESRKIKMQNGDKVLIIELYSRIRKNDGQRRITISEVKLNERNRRDSMLPAN